MNLKDIFTISNLHKAHIKARKSKLHKKEVIEFEINKSINVYGLYEQLNNKTYCFNSYRTFYIYEPKKRRVDSTSYKDRVVQHAFADNYLYPLLERHLIYDNAACRKNKGTDFARNRIKKYFVEINKSKQKNVYCLKFDIHQYFASINHDVLKMKIRKIESNKEILDFMDMIIDSFSIEENKGLPLGNQTSQCFGLYYLDELDRLIKEKYRIKWYSRYMDDGIILSSDKEQLKTLLREIRQLMHKIGLELNEKKTKIFPLTQGINYLGFHFSLMISGKVSVRLISKTRKRLIRHIKKEPTYLFGYYQYISLNTNSKIDYELANLINRKIVNVFNR